MESHCVRKSQRKCGLCVSEEEREKVRKKTAERKREREGERQAACVFVTNSRLLFILACDSQQPPHIRCEIGGGGEG